jgi:hypothetical protein
VPAQDLLDAFAAAFNAGEVDAMQALCTDDVEIEGIRTVLEGTFEDSFRIEHDDVFDRLLDGPGRSFLSAYYAGGR